MPNEVILIVEDNPKNLKLVRDTLQVKGYHTIEAETGEEGLRLARERRPALILMDIQRLPVFGFLARNAAAIRSGSSPFLRRLAMRFLAASLEIPFFSARSSASFADFRLRSRAAA